MTKFDYPISERIKGLKAKRERINKDLRFEFRAKPHSHRILQGSP